MTFGGLHPSSPVSPSPHAGSPSTTMSSENDYTTTTSATSTSTSTTTTGLDEMVSGYWCLVCVHVWVHFQFLR